MPERRVLIVDDARETLTKYAKCFEEAVPPWKVETASDEHEACDKVKRLRPDVVVCDLVLEQPNTEAGPNTPLGGMNVLQYVKGRDPLLPVILYTTAPNRMQRYKAFELGAFDCVERGPAGLVLSEELLVKANAAWRLREAIRASERASLLKRYFDPGVLKRFDENPELLKLRRATVTVCFWDIRKFSALCAALRAHPESIAEFLQDYFGTAAKVIFEHGGVLDKFIGDGVMGLFGALVDARDDGDSDAVAAVTSACAMSVQFDALVERWTPRWQKRTPEDITIGLGCGIHTGEVLVGNVGTEFRKEYTALGPHVNFTQRLVSIAESGDIIISASTETMVRSQFHLKFKETLKNVKNIPGDYKIWKVEGRK